MSIKPIVCHLLLVLFLFPRSTATQQAVLSHNKTRLHQSKEISLCLQHCKTLERSTALLAKLNSPRAFRFSFWGDNTAGYWRFPKPQPQWKCKYTPCGADGMACYQQRDSRRIWVQNQTSGGWLETREPRTKSACLKPKQREEQEEKKTSHHKGINSKHQASDRQK